LSNDTSIFNYLQLKLNEFILQYCYFSVYQWEAALKHLYCIKRYINKRDLTKV